MVLVAVLRHQAALAYPALQAGEAVISISTLQTEQELAGRPACQEAPLLQAHTRQRAAVAAAVVVAIMSEAFRAAPVARVSKAVAEVAAARAQPQEPHQARVALVAPVGPLLGSLER